MSRGRRVIDQQVGNNNKVGELLFQSIAAISLRLQALSRFSKDREYGTGCEGSHLGGHGKPSVREAFVHDDVARAFSFAIRTRDLIEVAILFEECPQGC